MVLDANDDMAFGTNVSGDCDAGAFGGCPPKVTYHDANGDGVYQSGEDIVFDANNNGIFD